MYYAIGMSVSSLQRESTDSLYNKRNIAVSCVNNLFISKHPDTTLLQEAAEVIKRFYAQLDSTPSIISLYDSEKRVALEVPREIITAAIILY